MDTRMSNLRIRDPDGFGYGDDRRKTSGGTNEERLEARVLELLGDKKAAIEACQRAEKEVRELNKIIQKRDDEIQDLRRGSKYNFSSNDEQIQKLRQQIDERDNIIMELEAKLSAKEAEIEQLKNGGDGTKRRSESSEVIKLQRRVISLQERLEESEKQNRNVDRGDGSSLKILQSQLKAAEEARVMAERRLATAERSLLDKEDEIKSADRNIKKLRKDLEEKETRLQSLVEQMGESRSQNSSTTYLRAQLDAANDTIKRLRDEMTERVRTLGSSNNSYMEEIEAKDAEISALTTRWKKALSESESLKDEVSSLNARLKELQIELDKTLEDNSNLSHTIDDLKMDLQQARSESYSFERRSSSFTGTPKSKSRSISPNGADVTSRMRDRIQDLEETLLAKSEELEEAREEQLRVQRELEIMRTRENEDRDDDSIRRSVGRYPAQEISRIQRNKSSNNSSSFPRRISESRGDQRREVGGTVNRRYVASQQLERALAGVDSTSKRRSNSAGRNPDTGDVLLNTYPMNDPDHPAFSSAIRRSSSKTEFNGSSSMTRSRTGNASPVTGSIRMRTGSGNTITAPVRVYDLTESDNRSTSRNRQPYSFKEAEDDPLTRTYPYAKHTAYEEISIRGRPNAVDEYSNPSRRGRSTDKYDGNSKIRSRSGEMIDEGTGTRARSRSRGRGEEDVLLLTYPAAASRHPVWEKDGDDLRSQLEAAKRETARLRRELDGR